MPRINEQHLDLERSIDFDKEEFLEALINAVHTTREEFERLYILEEYPVEIKLEDFTDMPDLNTAYKVTTKQEFHIRRKTPHEMADDVSHSLTQGEN